MDLEVTGGKLLKSTIFIGLTIIHLSNIFQPKKLSYIINVMNLK